MIKSQPVFFPEKQHASESQSVSARKIRTNQTKWSAAALSAKWAAYLKLVLYGKYETITVD